MGTSLSVAARFTRFEQPGATKSSVERSPQVAVRRFNRAISGGNHEVGWARQCERLCCCLEPALGPIASYSLLGQAFAYGKSPPRRLSAAVIVPEHDKGTANDGPLAVNGIEFSAFAEPFVSLHEATS